MFSLSDFDLLLILVEKLAPFAESLENFEFKFPTISAKMVRQSNAPIKREQEARDHPKVSFERLSSEAGRIWSEITGCGSQISLIST